MSLFSQPLSARQPVTYAAMLWLLVAQLIVMLPLIAYLPVWLIPVLLFSAFWRLQVMQGHLQAPGNLGILLLAVLGLLALVASGIPRISLDMMASLLMLGFAYKSLEVTQKRDGMVIILTGYLLLGVLYLYSQSMLTALYGFFAMTILTAAMIALQQNTSSAMLGSLRLAGLMLLLCLPLMVLLFIFVPRLAPLWAFTLPSQQAKTGMTDRMTPGDIASLSQSDELAFRVSFAGERPPQDALYWRGLVLNHFDGKTWTQFADDADSESAKIRLRSSEYAIKRRLQKRGQGLHYEVIYEKTAQPWLFSLTPVVDIEGAAIFGRDFRIMASKNLMEPLRIGLLSYPQALRDVTLTPWQRRSALQLPQQGNAKSRQLARKLLAQAGSKPAYVQAVLQHYREQDYHYTLRPATLQSADTVDEFLFTSKRGFCAHYAGSFVFLMRAAGIPARVIAGYQGGEWNEKGNYLAVHQYDAHAWTEVWLQGQGWVRIDPTRMVAPERIEQNLESAVQQEGSFLEGQLFATTKYAWLDNLRKSLDSSQYAWRKFVLGYDQESQAELLRRLFGRLSPGKIALWLAGFVGIIILFWLLALGLARRRSAEAPEHRLYRQFCKLLEKQGITRQPAQPPLAFARLASQQLPQLGHDIQAFSNLYSQLCYDVDSNTDKASRIQQLKALLKKLRNHSR